ncbi:MAG: hypothetical protein IKZ36_03030 [Kiritimatiellae bacterium]|nr:hypothetical protein [Kiritimatiellia bacterium]
MKFYGILFCVLAIALSGCANYTWKSSVPLENRSVFVAVFKNKSDVTGVGNSIARQVAREFQREGTYRLSAMDSAALEIQGIVDNVSSSLVALNREVGMSHREYRMKGIAKVSFIDKKSGRVLVDNRNYEAYTTFLSSGDMITSKKDASERLAEDFARQIVDDALTLNWKESKNDK